MVHCYCVTEFVLHDDFTERRWLHWILVIFLFITRRHRKSDSVQSECLCFSKYCNPVHICSEGRSGLYPWTKRINCKFFFEKLSSFHIIPHNVGLKNRKKPADGCNSIIRNNFLFLCVQVRTSKHKFSNTGKSPNLFELSVTLVSDSISYKNLTMVRKTDPCQSKKNLCRNTYTKIKLAHHSM